MIADIDDLAEVAFFRFGKVILVIFCLYILYSWEEEL